MCTARSVALYTFSSALARNSWARRAAGRSLNRYAQLLGCLFLLGAAWPTISRAQTFTTLLSFSQTNGANPYGTLIQGADGNFYGTTQFGGAYGQGEVYKITPAGAATVLHSFCSDFPTCSDGNQPFASLTLGSDGNFYGASINTVFRITPAGDLTTLYTFCRATNCADGSFDYAALAEGTDGSFYGVTYYGGVSTLACGSACGTIFKITPEGVLTTIHTFRGNDGYGPGTPLVLGRDGNFYGTASHGGTHKKGAIFKITPAGSYTLLHSFGGADGTTPNKLMQATDGNFYGTTNTGGTHDQGVAFKITLAGKLTVLRSFNQPNGAFPAAGLVQASDGNFYGTTYLGGAQSRGTIFKITPTGKLTTLYTFCSQTNCSDGSQPYAGLIQGSDGNLYGTALLGGNACGADGTCGTVFRLSLGLP